MASEYPTKGNPRSARPRLWLRIKVALPAIMMLVMFITGLTVFFITQSLFSKLSPGDTELADRASFLIQMFILGLGICGVAIGLALAFYVTAPLRQLAAQAETAAALIDQKEGARPASTDAPDVFGDLGVALERVVGSLDSYALDSYILDSLSGGIITISQEGILTSINPRAETMLGLSAEEVKGVRYDRVFPDHPSNTGLREVLRAGLEEAQTFSSIEATMLSRSGREVLLGASLTPLRDAEGKSLGIVLSFKDLAAVKHARAQIHRADQLATLGSFAAGMAHEIRNPLASLQGMVELLQEDMKPDDPKRPFVDTIQRNLLRLTKLTENLLGLAHPGERSVESTDLNTVLREAVELARHENPAKRVEVKAQFHSDLPPIEADGEKLGRAFLNILLNAFQATPEGGIITVSTGRLTGGSPLAQGQPALTAAIRNTGSYIPREARQRLFTPFYTTKDHGVGLGLAITHQIITAHSGLLTVESDPAEGTCFQVYLPLELSTKKER